MNGNAVRELEDLALSPIAYGFAIALGLIWGSFANVCIYRLPEQRSVVKPPSHCSACKTPIRWYDNLPLVSWLWLRGKCRACKAPFSARYLVVELLTGALFGFAWWWTVVAHQLFEPLEMRLLRFGIAAAFCFVMVVITFIDLDHKKILDKVTIPSMIVFYGLGVLLPERAWWEGLVGVVIGYGLPWLIGEIYYRLRKIEGLGLGDAMLLGVIGALFGWQGVVVSLFGGSVIGIFVSTAALLVARRDDDEPEPETVEARSEDGEPPAPSLLRTEVPFGPFLAMGAIFYLFAEPWIHVQLALLRG
jgi:leader peptidase (prepilin peptidase)/N-methyltransferase